MASLRGGAVAFMRSLRRVPGPIVQFIRTQYIACSLARGRDCFIYYVIQYASIHLSDGQFGYFNLHLSLFIFIQELLQRHYPFKATGICPPKSGYPLSPSPCRFSPCIHISYTFNSRISQCLGRSLTKSCIRMDIWLRRNLGSTCWHSPRTISYQVF